MKSVRFLEKINCKNDIIKNNFIYLKLLALLFLIFFFKNYDFSSSYHYYFKNNLIEKNFFVFDSNNLRNVQSHMYGFTLSKEGILTNNYYKKIKKYKEPEPNGVYILIRRTKNEIKINQDFYGSIGLYLYENKVTGYFAISNSFLLLEEYLIGKQNFSLNKDFADDLIIEQLCTPSINETLVKEITKLPSNIFIKINIKNKEIKYYDIDYKENTIPLYSDKGLKIIDKWVDKWGYIIRSLKKQTDNFYSDLTGGFDSRIVFAILLNSGVKLNDILIHSSEDKLYVHEEDFKIANNISSKLGFKLNNFKMDKKGSLFNIKDSISCTIYSKLGFHKEFYLQKKFLHKPLFHITGDGGELIRGNPGKSVKKYMESLSSNCMQIKEQQNEFQDATIRLCNRSIELLKQRKSYKNEFEITADLYYRGRTRSHFGTESYENFIANKFYLQPLIDSDIRQIKYNLNDNLSHDLLAYLYVRFAPELINFPFQGKRFLNPESVKKVKYLNRKFGFYEKKYDFKENFYIDKKRKSPFSSLGDLDLKYNGNAFKYLNEMINSNKIYYYIHKIYNDSVYKYSIEYINKSKYHPFRHMYSLIAIAKTLEDISINQKKLGFIQNMNEGEIIPNLFDY